MSVYRRLTGLAVAAALSLPMLVAAGGAAAAPLSATRAAPRSSSITVGSNPYDVAVAQNQGRAYVVNDGSVSVISLLTRRTLATFDTGGFHGQNAIALMRANTQGYLTNNLTDTVTVFDTETHRVLRHIPVGFGAVDVVKANTPDGQRAYVLTTKPAALQHPGRNELIAIDPATGKVVGRTPLPDFAYTMAVGPSSRSIWVGSNDDGRIWQVSTRNGKITKTIAPTRSGPVTGIAFAPGKKTAWVAGLGGLSSVDARSGKSRAFLTAPAIFAGFPQLGNVLVSSSGRYAFVVDSVARSGSTGSQVAAIDTRSRKVLWRVRTGSQAEGIALDKARGRAYVAAYDDDVVTTFAVPR